MVGQVPKKLVVGEDAQSPRWKCQLCTEFDLSDSTCIRCGEKVFSTKPVTSTDGEQDQMPQEEDTQHHAFEELSPHKQASAKREIVSETPCHDASAEPEDDSIITKATADSSHAPQGYWECPVCEEQNRYARQSCNNCGCNSSHSKTADDDSTTCPTRGESSIWLCQQCGECYTSDCPACLSRKETSEAKFEDEAPSRAEQELNPSEDRGWCYWSCKDCGEDNHNNRSACNNCGQTREPDEEPKPSATWLQRYWKCPHCDEDNSSSRIGCNNCGLVRDGRDNSECNVSPPAPADDGEPDRNREANRKHTVRFDGCDRAEVPHPTPHSPASTSSVDAFDTSVGSTDSDDDQFDKAPYIAEDATDFADVAAQFEKSESIKGHALVILHIYDVSSDERVHTANEVIRAVGAQTGAFHTGVEIFGLEWSYGYASPGESGVSFCSPTCNNSHRYREALVMGATPLNSEEVTAMVDALTKEWPGDRYDILSNNCCHFADAFCRELGVGPTPRWLTQLAGAGATLVHGFSAARNAVHEAVDAAAERAAAIDERYNISRAMDAITNREIYIDDSYFETKVQSLWAHTVENVQNVGILAGRAMDEVQKPITVDVEHVEAKLVSAISQLKDIVPASWSPYFGSSLVKVCGTTEPCCVEELTSI